MGILCCYFGNGGIGGNPVLQMGSAVGSAFVTGTASILGLLSDIQGVFAVDNSIQSHEAGQCKNGWSNKSVEMYKMMGVLNITLAQNIRFSFWHLWFCQ